MSEFGDQLKEEVQRIIEEPLPESVSEPMRIETEGVFNQDYLEEMDSFMDNPMRMVMKVLTDYLDSFKPRPLEFSKSEHKVKIFRMNDRTVLAEVEVAIEVFLNDGYCCHIPTVCNDFVIMDFSRRKETEEDERKQ